MSSTSQPKTHFAPAERADERSLHRIVRHFEENASQFELLDYMPDAIVVLNRHRQIVFANRALTDVFGLKERSDAYGQRPGELLGCRYSDVMSGGCGTSKHCALCGAPKAVLESLEGRFSVKECRIALKEPGQSLDVRVQASPMTAMGEPLSLVVIKDIADEKRRQVLERTFFHDILNTAAVLQNYAELMADSNSSPRDDDDLREVLPRLANQLVEEIVAQRLLLQAENGELEVRMSEIDPERLLRDVAVTYSPLHVATNRSIVVSVVDGINEFASDRTLLARVLGNMTRNALEASEESQTVTLGAEAGEGWVDFWVHNEGFIPKHIQLQLFQRSFSTKGEGRGIGTYSIRLLGEKYLGGKVNFHSTEKDGTTFRILLPRKLAMAA